MRRKLFYILSFLFFFVRVHGQNGKTDFTTLENNTYKYYLSGQYDSLIMLGEKGLADSMDYFYLRYRLGYAYFMKNKFRQAAGHFKKAYSFNSMEESSLKYLYDAYNNSALEYEALALGKKLSPEFLSSVKRRRKISLLHFYVEGGHGFTDAVRKSSDINLPGNKNKRGISNPTRSVTYLHTGFKFKAGNMVSIYQGYNFLNVGKQKIVRENNATNRINYDIIQHEYYINAAARMAERWLLVPAFHFISVNYNDPRPGEDSSWVQPGFKQIKLFNYTGILMVVKDFRLTKLSFGGSFSYINNDYKSQAILSLLWLPFGNLHFYSFSQVALFCEYTPAPGQKGQRIILEQSLGFKIFRKLWAELDFTYGNLSNYVEKNGFVVYGFMEKTHFRSELGLISPLFNKFELSLRYQLFSKEAPYVASVDNITNRIKPISYTQHNIIGGIKWKL